MYNSKGIKETLTPLIKKQMEDELNKVQNPIFVFLGIEQYVNIHEYERYIIDKESFSKNGNQEIFNVEWFNKVFTELNRVVSDPKMPYSILSFPQFSYLTSYIQPILLQNRIIIVRDGFRSLLPLPHDEFIERPALESIEERSEQMPLYMAEQMQIGNNYYYSIKTPIEDYKKLDVFQLQKPLKRLADDNDIEVIDTVSDPHGIDIFINHCLSENDFKKKVIVKAFKKQPMNDLVTSMLEKMNWLLGQFGGEVYELDESAIDEGFHPSEETKSLLAEYWGPDVDFRQLRVYKNPDYGKEIVSISQGLIVETIINEYKNAKEGKEVKDLFLTAPTGAGKSLLFQLPAFYVSSRNDVTIVVSPLIALMKDQVEQIRQDRNFEKVYYLNSELSLIDREKIIDDCKNGDIDILYLSPELLLSYDITYFIGDRHLGLLVVDEAHLITTWGRDFRVDYWFLGQHVNKIRKNCGYKFPMVAVTATAIYGGDNDMVFDSVNSLYMHDPHLYIGEVKRNNITFVIDNHERYLSRYDDEKEKETVNFIKSIAEEGVKTIVYAPYTKHIDRIMEKLRLEGNDNIAVAYHSGLSADTKQLAYTQFKDNEAKVMVATKAFGMGVDIPDIQLVYHHAPSGLLPDYVQEVGRAARIPSINGFASLSYALEDQRYSKTLYGMSALRHYQIRAILDKINRLFIAGGRKRNMLVSADDFSYIFENTQDYDQKVMTALMMIEKDYLAKYRFNVLIARPKKLFVKVFARVDSLGMNLLKQKHSGCYRKLFDMTKDLTVVELDLDKIWKNHFSDRSFPMLKREFYKGNLLDNEIAQCKPQVKVIFTLENEPEDACAKLYTILDGLQTTLSTLSGKYFTTEEFDTALSRLIPKTNIREKIVSFLLSTYSGRNLRAGKVDSDAFLQRRKFDDKDKYIVFNSQYSNNFAKLKKRMQKMFEKKEDKTSSQFASYDSELLTNYVRLGSLLEILGIGSYECRGGDKPMIFIRINEPSRVSKDANDTNYNNSLLTNIEKRHSSSSEIFDHFFLHTFENKERWDFIEDFFLGDSNDELFEKHPGGERNHIDIISYIRNHMNQVNSDEGDNKRKRKSMTFSPREGGNYFGKDQLTIDGVTRSISKWIDEDPVELDKIRRKFDLTLNKDSYTLLVSKIKNNHFPYYRDIKGLSLNIEFPGYTYPVKAKIPYDQEPVKFYKWWHKNEDKVSMSKKELIELLIKVNDLNEKALLKKHREILLKKKF